MLASVAATVTALPDYAEATRVTALVARYSTALIAAAGILLAAAALSLSALTSRTADNREVRSAGEPTDLVARG